MSFSSIGSSMGWVRCSNDTSTLKKTNLGIIRRYRVKIGLKNLQQEEKKSIWMDLHGFFCYINLILVSEWLIVFTQIARLQLIIYKKNDVCEQTCPVLTSPALPAPSHRWWLLQWHIPHLDHQDRQHPCSLCPGLSTLGFQQPSDLYPVWSFRAPAKIILIKLWKQDSDCNLLFLTKQREN